MCLYWNGIITMLLPGADSYLIPKWIEHLLSNSEFAAFLHNKDMKISLCLVAISALKMSNISLHFFSVSYVLSGATDNKQVDLNKMADILQMLFSNAFFGRHMFYFDRCLGLNR